MSLHDLEDVINALLAGSAEQRKKISEMERRLAKVERDIEKLSQGPKK